MRRSLPAATHDQGVRFFVPRAGKFASRDCLQQKKKEKEKEEKDDEQEETKKKKYCPVMQRTCVKNKTTHERPRELLNAHTRIHTEFTAFLVD
jgi:hypothetical protein